MCIYQGVSNDWNRGFESNSNHANNRISAFFFVSAVLWMSCQELISYTKNRDVARNEEKKKKMRVEGGGGESEPYGHSAPCRHVK